MTYGILFEKVETTELPPGFYYAHVPALGLTTYGQGIEGARAAAEDLVRLWLSEKKGAGESIGVPFLRERLLREVDGHKPPLQKTAVRTRAVVSQ